MFVEGAGGGGGGLCFAVCTPPSPDVQPSGKAAHFGMRRRWAVGRTVAPAVRRSICLAAGYCRSWRAEARAMQCTSCSHLAPAHTIEQRLGRVGCYSGSAEARARASGHWPTPANWMRAAFGAAWWCMRVHDGCMVVDGQRAQGSAMPPFARPGRPKASQLQLMSPCHDVLPVSLRLSSGLGGSSRPCTG